MMKECSGNSAMELEAWLLHKVPSGESSVRVYFFTKEQGILHCWYKGGRTPKKQAILQPFMPLWLSLDQRREHYYVRQLESLAAPLLLKNIALYSACYINELLYYALKPCDAHPDLFDA